MTYRIVEKGIIVLAAAIPLLVIGALFALPAPMQDVRFDSSGELLRPTGYREWVYVGTPLTPNDMNGGEAPFPEFHSVYINDSAWNTYKRTGKFADGTVVVKELLSVGTKQASSGKGYFMGEFIGLEAAVKDSKRFPTPGSRAGLLGLLQLWPQLSPGVQDETAEDRQLCRLPPRFSRGRHGFYPVLPGSSGRKGEEVGRPVPSKKNGAAGGANARLTRAVARQADTSFS